MGQKHVKMVLYGEPGVGKSTFASKAPNPFFICTDGNFEWLDLPDSNHIEVTTWTEAKAVFAKLKDPAYANYETIVVDLIEDLFKWCEQEFCKRNRIEHVGDLGFGKGYDISRNEFTIEISKLFGLNKNIILIAHGMDTVVKDRRGVDKTKHVPSNRIPDKVWEVIEGRTRYFLRCYTKAEENENGKLVKRRYLKLIPQENEYGIARGIDEASTPEDIPLDWNVFAEVIGLNDVTMPSQEEVAKEQENNTKVVEEAVKTVIAEKPTVTSAPRRGRVATTTAQTAKEPSVKEEPVVEEKSDVEKFVAPTVTAVDDTPMPSTPAPEVSVETIKKEVTNSTVVDISANPAPTKEQSNADRIAAIKAKLAARKG